jgi:hypothetical protein
MLKKYRTSFVISGLILLTLITKSFNIIVTNENVSISFAQVATLADITWSLYVISLLAASLLFKGWNNKATLILCTVGFMIETLIWESMLYNFIIQGAQPYIMNWALPVCMIPLVILLRYRIRFTTFFCTQLMRTNRYNKWAENTLSTLKMTRIELVFRWWIVLVFTIDFFQAIYLTAYSMIRNIPWNGSIYATIMQHNDLDVFEFFYIIQLLANFAVVVVLLRYSFLDRKQPDKDNIKLSFESKERLIKTMNTLNQGFFVKGKENHGVAR